MSTVTGSTPSLMIQRFGDELLDPDLVQDRISYSTILQTYPFEYDAPGDGNCLFWAFILAMFTPITNLDREFQEKFCHIFLHPNRENQETICLEEFKSFIQSFDGQQFNLHLLLKDKIIHYLRSLVINHMALHREEFIYFIENNEPFEFYLDKMKKNGQWAGECEIKALSDLFGLKILVVKNQMDSCPLYGSYLQSQNEILVLKHLLYRNPFSNDCRLQGEGNHYGFLLSQKLEFPLMGIASRPRFNQDSFILASACSEKVLTLSEFSSSPLATPDTQMPNVINRDERDGRVDGYVRVPSNEIFVNDDFVVELSFTDNLLQKMEEYRQSLDLMVIDSTKLALMRSSILEMLAPEIPFDQVPSDLFLEFIVEFLIAITKASYLDSFHVAHSEVVDFLNALIVLKYPSYLGTKNSFVQDLTQNTVERLQILVADKLSIIAYLLIDDYTVNFVKNIDSKSLEAFKVAYCNLQVELNQTENSEKLCSLIDFTYTKIIELLINA